MPSLLIGTQRVVIREPELTIGSSERCDVVIEGSDIHPEHAYIKESQGALMIVSATRLCELYVNGKKTRRQVLKHQDRVDIGKHHIEYHFYDPHEASPRAIDERLGAYQRLYEFSRRVAEQLRSSELFEVILEELVTLTRADHGILVSLDQQEYSIRATVDRFERDEALEVETAAMSESVIHQVMTTRQPLLWNDLLDNDEFDASRSMLEIGLCSVMCAPLIVQGELLGAIYVGSHRPQCFFEGRDLKALCVFSAQAATLLKSARAQDALVEDNQRLRQERESSQFGEMIGSSEVMSKVYLRVERLSGVDANLLVTGETGTGKELIAREVHRRSQRRDAPFVSINCGALPEGLAESELFGYRAGAFTGAERDKEGGFVSAQGGTLFLDEIGELPLSLQVKLLRVLEERAVRPLGSNEVVPLDVRLICATNVELERAIQDDLFRHDLYYRINVTEIRLPALRERGEDVLMIAKILIKRLAERYERPPKPLSLEAREALTRYAWPGNIRELENRLNQAFILSDSLELTLSDLNLRPAQLDISLLSLKEAQERFSRDYVRQIVDLNRGNRSQAARDLGVDPRTVFRYLERDKKRVAP